MRLYAKHMWHTTTDQEWDQLLSLKNIENFGVVAVVIFISYAVFIIY